MSFNTIILVGNLGRDPELRYTPQGDAVCSFSMATNEKRKDRSGEFVDVTHWFKITLWRRMAENAAKYLTKGSPVYIQGRLGVEEWTDRDNNNRFTLTVQASDMQFISAGKSDGEQRYSAPRDDNFPTHSGGGAPAPSATSNPAASAATHAPVPAPLSPAVDDDIPF